MCRSVQTSDHWSSTKAIFSQWTTTKPIARRLACRKVSRPLQNKDTAWNSWPLHYTCTSKLYITHSYRSTHLPWIVDCSIYSRQNQRWCLCPTPHLPNPWADGFYTTYCAQSRHRVRRLQSKLIYAWDADPHVVYNRPNRLLGIHILRTWLEEYNASTTQWTDSEPTCDRRYTHRSDLRHPLQLIFSAFAFENNRRKSRSQSSFQWLGAQFCGENGQFGYLGHDSKVTTDRLHILLAHGSSQMHIL